MARSWYRKKRYIIPIVLLVALIIFRIMLPGIVKRTVNKALADIPGYYGELADVDISLIRGAYVLEGLYLNKLDAQTQVPFLNFPVSDISVEWKALLKGRVVCEIVMTSPEVIYVFEDQQTQDTEVEDWTKALTEIVPIDINRLEIKDGKTAFVQIAAEPTIDLHIAEIYAVATNLQNVVQKERNLPSTIEATGVSVGGGRVKLDGKMDILKEIPDMDISCSLENADAPEALNDFTEHYAKLDFERGSFNIYSEIAIADGFMTGYIKPILEDSKLIGEEDGFLETIWEGLVGFFKFILKNHSEDTVATKVPLEGDLNNVQSAVWPTITNIFKNAWIEAFKFEADNTVDFQDAEELVDEEDPKERKKKEREKRRQERKRNQ